MSRARDLAAGTFSGAFSADSPTLVVDATNNRVGVGTASPDTLLNLESAAPTLQLAPTTQNNSSSLELGVLNAGTNAYAKIDVINTATYDTNIRFFTNTDSSTTQVERMRINKQGQITMGGSSHADDILYLTRSNDGKVQRFYRGASEVGYISVTSSSTSYNTSSDYRLKENVADLTGAIDRVKQVPVHRFNFIDDPDKTVDGFLAHEVQSVVPEAISGTKDEVDEDGNPVYQGIDQSKLVPLLTAAIKEQQALIEDLQTRLAALENA